jgi:hypothetical protein
MVAYEWMHAYKQDPSDSNAVKLMLAVQISCGARKTGVIDPSIEYYSWAGWRIKAMDEFGIDIDNENQRFKFGDDTSEIEAKTDLVLETFKEDRILIQYGVSYFLLIVVSCFLLLFVAFIYLQHQTPTIALISIGTQRQCTTGEQISKW